jgi:Cu+-exporting ATPase
VEDEEQEKMYLIAKLLEEGSSHPLARAVVRYREEKTQLQGRSLEMEDVAGKGSKGRIEIDGKNYRAVIGSENSLVENGIVGIDGHQGLLTKWKMAGKSDTDSHCGGLQGGEQPDGVGSNVGDSRLNPR